MNDVVLWRRLVAETLGSAFLAAVVIGSGIAAQHLSPGQRRSRAVRERGRHSDRAVHDHLDVRPDLGGTLQPGRVICGRRLRWPSLARRSGLSAGTGGGLHRWSRARQSDVLEGGDLDLDQAPGLGRTLALRGRRHLGPVARDLRPRPIGPVPDRPGRGRCLHRGRLLLHELDELRQPGDRRRPDVLRHLRWDRPLVCPELHQRRDRRRAACLRPDPDPLSRA